MEMPPLIKQGWVLLGIVLVAMHAGAQLGLVGCIVQGAVPASDPVEVSTGDSAWIASTPAITMMLSIPLASYMMDRLGRRVSLAATTLPSLTASLVISRATSVAGLILGRLILGVALDSLILGAIITGECTAPKYRGVFLNIKSAAMILGSSIIHFLNYYLDWRILSLLTAPLALAALAIICTSPESPHWYILKNRYEEAEKSFFWLRGRSVEAQEEFKSLVNAQKLRASEAIDRNVKVKLAVWQTLKKKNFLLPVFAIYLASILLEATGRNTFITFAVKLVADIVGENDKSSIYIVFIDIVTISSVLFSCLLVRHVPRRTLMFVTGFTSAILLSLLSLYLYLQSAGLLPVALSSVWIPITLLAAFFLLVNVGCVPICITMHGELLPLAHKGLGVMITGIASKLNILSTMLVMPFLLDTIKVQGTFASSALVMMFTLIGLYFTLPETKDKTLQDIEDAYQNRKKETAIDGEELKEMISHA